MGMGSALLWRPGQPAGLHCLTFSQTCVPPTPPPTPRCLSPVPQRCPQPGSVHLSCPCLPCLVPWLSPAPPRTGFPRKGYVPSCWWSREQAGRGRGRHRDRARDTETGPEIQRRGQRHRDRARDTEIQGQREGETWRDTETHSREAGRSSVCRVSGFGPGSVQRRLVCKDLRPGSGARRHGCGRQGAGCCSQ